MSATSHHRLLFFVAAAFFILAAARSAAGIIYVDASAPPGGDGQSWATAHFNLGDGINAAQPGDEVHVAGGTYAGTFSTTVTLRGGYAGKQDLRDPDRRDYERFETVLDHTGGADPGPVLWVRNALVEGITVTGGTNPEIPGSAVFLQSGALRWCRVEHCTGSYAQSDLSGMTIWVSGPSLISHCIVSNNRNLAAIFVYYCDPGLIVQNSIITDNAGHGIFVDGGNNQVVNCTISNNGGTGLLAVNAECGARVDLQNSILWGNAKQFDDSCSLPMSCAELNISNCFVQDDQTCCCDPGFLNPNDGDYRLAPGSPCIDAGDNSLLPPDVTVDLGGRPRRVDDPGTPDTGSGAPPIVDLGAYEFHPAATWYVDAAAPAGGDGRSWSSAFRYLQDALHVAYGSDEARIAQGTYKPDQSEYGLTVPLDRAATFQIGEQLQLVGGFAGSAGSDPNANNPELFATILSGDLLGNDVPGWLSYATGPEPTRQDNSYHVLYLLEGSTVQLSGLIIERGHANLDTHNGTRGSGIFGVNITIRATNCIIRQNFCGTTSSPVNDLGGFGGGAYLLGDGTFTDCSFENNVAGRYPIAEAGGMLLNGPCTLVRTRFHQNLAAIVTGALETTGPTIVDTCTFTGNEGGVGPAAANLGDVHKLRNTRFVGNHASWECVDLSLSGCAMEGCLFSGGSDTAVNLGGQAAQLTNCTFVGFSGSALYLNGGTAANIANCIVWADGVPFSNPNVNVHHSIVRGGWPGIGNSAADPRFFDPNNGDFHLVPASPAIDAGDNAALPGDLMIDLDGRTRRVDDPATPDTGSGTPPIVDIGAYEFQYAGPDCNGNGVPDADDIAAGASQDCNNNGIPDECDSIIPGDLVFWNRLGSADQVHHSAVGPNLAFATELGWNLPGTPQFDSAVFGAGLTLADGPYSAVDRVRNAALTDVPAVINSERGTVEAWFNEYQTPLPYEHNCYRIFDGPFGLGYSVWLHCDDYNGQPRLQFDVFMGGTQVSARSLADGQPGYSMIGRENTWLHVAGVWDRSGIAGGLDCVRLYVNGLLVAANTANNWGTHVDQNADIAGGNDFIAHCFAVDNLKIWRSAKTNFADRLTEGYLTGDCNHNGILDQCDLAAGTSHDCNGNGVPDECDIAGDASADVNEDGVPDECEHVFYVDDDAPGGGDGRTWAGAFRLVGEALALAQNGDMIHVGAGVYRETLTAPDRILLIGGYAGLQNPANPDDWDPDRHGSILSGDVNGDDLPGFANYDDNLSHLLIGPGSLLGFTIRGARDGAVYASAQFSSITLRRCRLVENTGGPGAAVYTGGFPGVLEDCILEGNGGAPAVFATGMLQMARCQIVRNHDAGLFGGYLIGRLEDCLIADNQGPGVHLTMSQVDFVNCTLVRNAGPGAYLYADQDYSHVTFTNSILWRNADGAHQLVLDGSTYIAWMLVAVDYCDIEGGSGGVAHQAGELQWGEHNVNLDPLFISPLGGDGIAGTLDDDFRLAFHSSCIDRGDNTALADPNGIDLAGYPRRADDPATPNRGNGTSPIVDLGAYEFHQWCPGDLTSDQRIGLDDLAVQLSHYGQTGASAADGDLDGDHDVDLGDLSMLLSRYGEVCY